jgi:NAD(P)-dependent dehydrogenase (short-subunit alcohol dehydrogenase family)
MHCALVVGAPRGIGWESVRQRLLERVHAWATVRTPAPVAALEPMGAGASVQAFAQTFARDVRDVSSGCARAWRIGGFVNHDGQALAW